jgi:hypothetical protein
MNSRRHTTTSMRRSMQAWRVAVPDGRVPNMGQQPGIGAAVVYGKRKS